MTEALQAKLRDELLGGTIRGGVAVGDGDPPQFCEWSRVRARKTHRCFECLEPIEPGESYHVLSGRWHDGGFQRFKYCGACKRWADGAFFVLKLELYPLGLLDEAIAELTRHSDGWHYVEPRPRL